ncbi:fat-body protein 1 [Stomoxys calcitrans]|uniref:fat-body protein 1 n=1 Tax=Stomoxys calcitrans TaxID=35570 RepID=UPI0027E2A6E6|nr:fat-body protein 1 [Stomoxys calcitrans]
MDRTEVNPNVMMPGTENLGRLATMSREELLRQKFILDILNQVELPLQNPEWLQVQLEDVIDRTQYIGPLDEDMMVMLDLMRTKRVLGANEMCSLTQEQHLRQLIGLYRLMVRCRSFEMLQRLAIYARQNINPVLFVNALTLAIADREDTRMLITPAIYEILPRLYNKAALLRQVENVQRDVMINGNVVTMRSNIMDIIDMGQKSRLMKSRLSQMPTTANGMIDKSQLWMPWRNMRMQLALQKTLGGRVIMPPTTTDTTSTPTHRIMVRMADDDKPMGLLADDMGLRAWLNILLDELILEQGNRQNALSHVDMDQRLSRPVNQIRSKNIPAENEMPSNSLNNNLNRWSDNMARETSTDNRRNLPMPRREEMPHSMDRNADMENRKSNIDMQKEWNRDVSMIGQQQQDDMMKRSNPQILDSMEYRTTRVYAEKNIPNMKEENDSNGDMMKARMGSRKLIHEDLSTLERSRESTTEGDRENARMMPRKHLDEDLPMVERRRGSTDEDDWTNARTTPNMMLRKHLDEELPTTSIDNDGLLHDSGRRLNLLHRELMGKMNRNPIEMQQNQNSHIRSNIGLPWERKETTNLRMEENDDEDIPRVGASRLHLIHADLHGKESWNPLQARPSLERQANTNMRSSWGMQEGTNERLDDVLPRLPQSGGRNPHLIHNDMLGKKNIDRLDLNSNAMMRDNEDGTPNWWTSQDMPRRLPRSIDRMLNGNDRMRMGQIILNSMQELVARLNVEQMSLEKDTLKDNKKIMTESKMSLDTMLNDMHMDEHSRLVVMEKMNEIAARLESSMQQAIQHLSNRQSYNDLMNVEMDKTHALHMDQIAMGEILHEIMALSEYVQDGQISNIMENSVTQLLLRHIVNCVEQQMQKLQRERSVKDIMVAGVHINNVKVDKLQTFIEVADVDLSNMLGRGETQTKQTIIGRMPRLNHKTFSINMDMNSDRNQRVVVRLLLAPKNDAMGNALSLDQLRQHVMLLDIVNIELKAGRNVIKRKSRDITWTSRDVTPYSEMYQRVMKALQGEMDWMADVIVGQTNMMPHRLLLPRGHVDGLPMQLMVVVTPASEMRQDLTTTRLGMDSWLIDDLPTHYPMDRQIINMQEMLMLPNVCLTDVMIYHEN